MPQLDWNIKIIPSGTGAEFQPNLPNAKPGDPLNARQSDIVSWGNRTNQVHQPWPTVGNDPNGDPVPKPASGDPPGYLSDPIPPNDSSRPQFVVPGNPGDTINYCCYYHPTERGQIIVVPPL
jgi:hypothetical protein